MDSYKLPSILEEFKCLTLLALPTSIMCLTEGFQMKLSNILIGRVSGEVSTQLSALFMAQMFLSCFSYSISEGLALYIMILCSRAHGANKPKLACLYYYRVLMLTILLCFPLFSLFVSVGPIIYFFTQSWELSLGAGSYTTIYCFGFPAYVYYKVSISFLSSQNIVWIQIVYLLIGNLSNALLQYIFIFHYNLGIAGAAASYVISVYIIALLVFAHLRLSHQLLFQIEFSIEMFGGWYHTAKYVVAAVVQTLTSCIVGTVLPIILLLLVCFDEDELAIYSIMYSVWYLFSLFTSGYSKALTIRVGYLLGADSVTQAKKSAVWGMVLSEIVLIFFAIMLFLFNQPLSNLFTTDERFIEELSYNLRIFPVIILSDVIIFGQGVMNGCGMQRTQAVLKFILLVGFGLVSEFILIKYFTWKALFMYSVQGIIRVLCFVCSVVILFLSDWNTFIPKKCQNDQLMETLLEPPILHRKFSTPYLTTSMSYIFKLRTLSNSKIFVLSRYCTCLLLGSVLFLIVKWSL